MWDVSEIQLFILPSYAGVSSLVQIYTTYQATATLRLGCGLLRFRFFPFSKAFADFKSRPRGSSFLT